MLAVLSTNNANLATLASGKESSSPTHCHQITMPNRRRKSWFWVWTLLATVQKHRRQNPQALCEVWKNLIIVSGFDEKEALRKAKRIGRSQEGDCRGSLCIHGKPAICKFIGIADMGLIHDELKDGAEIVWQLKRCTQRTAKSLAQVEPALLERARNEKRYFA